jgi:uncharacterized protein YndB with AHSA1/START domain
MWAELTRNGTARGLIFDRRIARPIEKVWAALITPARLGDWLCADADVEPRVGGKFHLAFRNGPHTMHGVITRFEPPHTLEYTWPEAAANGDSTVLWELAAAGDGTHLKLTHTLPTGGDIPGFASGWHWHLDAIPAAVDGVATPWSDAQWKTLQADYAERFGP